MTEPRPRPDDVTLGAVPTGPARTRGESETIAAPVNAAGTAGAHFATPAPSSFRQPLDLERAGQTIGPFTLIKKLGEGGFGVVWLAERQKPYQQRVALKLLNPGMDSRAVLARFDQERQALAVMNHPNVAKVIDGGVTELGRPYFAMEFVKGAPIDEFADERHMDIRSRLSLFLQVCAAVQHAHTKGLIHRDLKPGNVLVAADDEGDPVTKVIDFGVAKALTARPSDAPHVTEVGQMIGTPEYMSPEQAEPDAADIDTRSDVYSLGVILYELLVGALPFEPGDLRSHTLRDIQRILREDEPPTPCKRLSTLVVDRERATAIATARRTRIDDLSALLRRELEWIPLKAMRKERDRRYSSPHDLALDIENYLEGRPLLAAPESRTYLVKKFLRRHKVAVAAWVAVSVSLVTGAIVSTTSAIAEARARRQAEQRERELGAILGQQVALTSEFGAGDTGSRLASELMRQVRTLATDEGDDAARAAMLSTFEQGLRSINMTDVASTLVADVMLERAVTRANTTHRGDPFVRAGLLNAAAHSYYLLGKRERAHELFADSLELSEGVMLADDRRALSLREWVARTDPDTADGEEDLRAVIADRTLLYGPSDAETVSSRRALAAMLEEQGRLGEALEEHRAVFATPELAPETQVAEASAVGDLQRRQGAIKEAIETLRGARRGLDALPNAPEPLQVAVLTNLGLALADPTVPDTNEEGLDLLRRAGLINSDYHGDAHPLSFDMRGNLAASLYQLEDGSGARLPEIQRLVDDNRRIGASLVSPPNEYLIAIIESAVIMGENAPEGPAGQATLAEAVALAEDAVRLIDARRIADGVRWRDVRKAVAYLYRLADRPRDAERVLRKVRELWIAADSATAIPVFNVTADLAGTLVDQGRLREAAELLRAQQEAQPQRATNSGARWKNSVALRDVLRDMAKAGDASAAKQLEAQDKEVAMLRGVREEEGLNVSADTPAQ